MKAKILEWLGVVLILSTGIIHLYLFPEEFEAAPALGYLFVANFLAAVVASTGIRHQKAWGWVLGVVIAAGSIYGYILSRTVGLPGMEVEAWLYPIGVLAVILEAGFLAVALIKRPWGSLTYASKVTLATVYLASVIVFGFFGYLGSIRLGNTHQVNLSATKLVSGDVLLEQYGVQVKLIGLSMMGSIIDFRLSIIDAEKAKKLLNDPEKMPMLVVGSNDTVLIAPMPHGHQHRVKDGGIFFVFFPNTGNLIQPGTPVSVVFGDLQVGPVPAQ